VVWDLSDVVTIGEVQIVLGRAVLREQHVQWLSCFTANGQTRHGDDCKGAAGLYPDVQIDITKVGARLRRSVCACN